MSTLDRDLLTPDEVVALAAAPSRTAPSGIRNRSLVLFLASTGLRISEALGLKPKDVDLVAGTVIVQRGKGGKSRVVAITMPEACDALARWMDRRTALGVSGRRRVFCTLDGGPLLSSYIRAMLPRLARRAKIEKRVHAHGLRHFYACMLARSRTPVASIQATLGHSSLATTAVYLGRIAPEEHLDAARAGMKRAWGSAAD
jgi:site-specific recombinase XerD